MEDFIILQIVNFYIYEIIGSIIFFIGMFFNFTSLVYFKLSRSFYDTSMRHYFIVLSFTDSIRLTEWLFAFLIDKQIITLSKQMCSAFLFITILSGHISVWLLVFLSIERYFVIKFPFRGKQIYSTKNSILILCLVIALLILFDLPYLMPNFIVKSMINYELHLFFCNTNENYRSYLFSNNILFYSLIPFVFLLTFNILLISLLHRSETQHRKLTQRSNRTEQNNKNDRNFKEKTILLISFTFFLIVTVSPRYIYMVIIILTKDTGLKKISIAK